MQEKILHKQICTFLKNQYPKVEFNTDLSGIKLTKGQAVQLKALRSNKGFPDITIYKPTTKFHGLFLEVKKESPFKIKGGLKAGEHLKEQSDKIEKLNKLGYYATFVWSLDMAIIVINNYMET